MNLSTKEYHAKYHPDKSKKTVYRMIALGNLPSTHTAQKIGNSWAVTIGDETWKEKSERLEIACTAVWYQVNTNKKLLSDELIATYAMKYGVDFIFLKKILGR